MKSSFLDLAEKAEELVQCAQAGQLTATEQRNAHNNATRHIAGLSVTPPIEVQASLDTSVKDVINSANMFATEASILQTMLLNMGIKPLVILPKTMWEAIVQEAELYTFHNGEGGNKVNVSKAIREIPNQITLFMAIISRRVELFLSLLSTVSAILFFLLLPRISVSGAIPFSPFVLVPAQIVVSVMAGFALYYSLYFLFEKFGFRGILNYKVSKAGGMHQFLWPDKKEPLGDSYFGTPTVRVQFPTPPQEVQETLYLLVQAKMRQRISLVVDKGAITFLEDPMSVMMCGVQEEVKKEKARVKALRADPIVVLSGEGLSPCSVAIIAQYGDFPIEQEAVAKAIEQFSFSTNY